VSRAAASLALVLSCAAAWAQEPPPHDAVTRASPPASKTAPVVTRAQVDGAALRVRNRARLAEDRAPVVVLRGESALELGQRICEQVVPRRPPSTPVLLKPNLGGFDWWKTTRAPGDDDGLTGRITQPEFVRGVIRCLKARGHTNIVIADGWDSPHADWMKLIRLSGYEAMAREEGVPLYALDDDGVFDVEAPRPAEPLAVSGMAKTHVPTLLMPRAVAEALQGGLFISIPKLKTHRFGVFSIGLKGMQGVVMMSDAAPAHRQKYRMHREITGYLKARKQRRPETPGERATYIAALEAFAERIADVVEVEAPDAVLVDAAPFMGGDGFQKLWPSSELLALGGTNVVLVDRVGAELLGLWDSAALGRELGGHTTSPLLETAARRFGIDIRAPALDGDGVEVMHRKRPVHYVAMAPFEIHDDAPPAVHAAPLGTVAPPVIDGRGDDPAWSAAREVRWDTDHAGRRTGIVTSARFLWSEGTLYGLWELEDAGLNVDGSQPVESERKDLYVEDCVEMMLAPRPDEPWRFYEIELGPLGHFFDLEIDLHARQRENPGWSAGLRVAATHDAARRRAVIEAAFSAPEIAALLRAGASLPIGLFRMEGRSSRAYLSWRPGRTARPNFHQPEGFGVLVIDP